MNNQYLLEYDTFFRLISYYLPSPLNTNEHFVQWLRNTEGLSDQFATEILYNLPKPRESHYQHDFFKVRRIIATYLYDLEEFISHSPIMLTSESLTRIHALIFGIHLVGLVFNMIKMIFIIISIMIIYSLLMITVESKTFEVAV